MKYVEEYLNNVIKIKPLGKLTTKEDELNGLSGEMVYINDKCSDIFISHADYANWLEKQAEKKGNNKLIWKHWKNGIAGNGEGEPIYLTKVDNTHSLSSCLGFECDYIELSELDNLMFEKQSEQNFTDQIEPKFKVGDFLVNDYCMGKVIELTNDAYLLDTGQGIPFSCEHNVHLWTIQDARDGDVLCCESGWTCIFKALNSDISFSSYCFMDNTGWFCETGSESHTLEKAFIKAYNGNVHPATKEQRDLLFQKIHDAGYKWDVDKKKLKKIEDKPLVIDEGKDEIDKSFTKMMLKDYTKQNLVWSEEDEKMLGKYIDAASGYYDPKEKDSMKLWLKSFKERIQPQPKQEWSEDDEQYLLVCKNALRKYQVTDKWDSNIISQWLDNKLKSLRPRQWKPSEEQMRHLASAIEESGGNLVLDSLYEQLKQLYYDTNRTN